MLVGAVNEGAVDKVYPIYILLAELVNVDYSLLAAEGAGDDVSGLEVAHFAESKRCCDLKAIRMAFARRGGASGPNDIRFAGLDRFLKPGLPDDVFIVSQFGSVHFHPSLFLNRTEFPLYLRIELYGLCIGIYASEHSKVLFANLR